MNTTVIQSIASNQCLLLIIGSAEELLDDDGGWNPDLDLDEQHSSLNDELLNHELSAFTFAESTNNDLAASGEGGGADELDLGLNIDLGLDFDDNAYEFSSDSDFEALIPDNHAEQWRQESTLK